jgi:hypothetical protein
MFFFISTKKTFFRNNSLTRFYKVVLYIFALFMLITKIPPAIVYLFIISMNLCKFCYKKVVKAGPKMQKAFSNAAECAKVFYQMQIIKFH